MRAGSASCGNRCKQSLSRKCAKAPCMNRSAKGIVVAISGIIHKEDNDVRRRVLWQPVRRLSPTMNGVLHRPPRVLLDAVPGNGRLSYPNAEKAPSPKAPEATKALLIALTTIGGSSAGLAYSQLQPGQENRAEPRSRRPQPLFPSLPCLASSKTTECSTLPMHKRATKE